MAHIDRKFLGSLGVETERSGPYECSVCSTRCGGMWGDGSVYECYHPKCRAVIICSTCVKGWLSKSCPVCGSRVEIRTG